MTRALKAHEQALWERVRDQADFAQVTGVLAKDRR